MRFFLPPLFFLMIFQLSGQELLINSFKDLSEKLNTLTLTLKQVAKEEEQTKIPVYLHPNQAAVALFENLKKEIGNFDSEDSILDEKAEIKPGKKALVFINWVGNRFDLMLPTAGIKKVIENIKSIWQIPGLNNAAPLSCVAQNVTKKEVLKRV